MSSNQLIIIFYKGTLIKITQTNVDNSHEKEDKEAPLNQNENSAPVGKTEGVDEVDKTSNETVLKGSDTVTNDKENTSKEVIVLENGSVEITEEIETNNNENEELAENKQEMTMVKGILIMRK